MVWFYDMSHNMGYCKDCPYYKSHPGAYYDCNVQSPASTDSAWGFCKNRVLSIECRKFIDEINDNKDNLDEKSKNYIMPFGKYKGMKLKDIPFKYIDWIYDRDWLKMPLAKYVRAYYHYEYRRLNSDALYSDGGSADPYDTCPFSMYNEVGYGDLC